MTLGWFNFHARFWFPLKLIYKNKQNYRLPTIFKPQHYNVDLKVYLDPENQGENYDGSDPQHFDGISSVDFEVSEDTKKVVLHAKYLEISSLTLFESDKQAEMKISWELSDKYEYLIIETQGLGSNWNADCFFGGKFNFGPYVGLSPAGHQMFPADTSQKNFLGTGYWQKKFLVIDRNSNPWSTF